ncbi:MAG: hypothetical protein AB8B74_15570 [Crocinitomicaceae bacterium]
MVINNWIQYIIYFLFIVLLQGLVVNNLQIGVYAYPMIYILAILVLPFEFGIIATLGIAIVLGVFMDALSDTFGLHTSATVFIAYSRPMILKVLKPRDGYELALMPTIHDMGILWFSAYFSIAIVVHHIWFFILEIFRFDLIGLIALKIIVSSFLSFCILFGLQYLLYKPSK